MSIFTIADLHLSTHELTNKSMEVFRNRWDGYMERLRANWEAVVSPTDTVIVPGDISWALSLEESASDMHFIDRLPGKKILGKGNHDFWWCTMRKHQAFFEKEDIHSISFLFNNAYEVEEYIIAGTRGWFMEEDAGHPANDTDFEKMKRRELLRLTASLDAAKVLQEKSGKEILAFTHFPPVWNDKEMGELPATLERYGVRRVYYGHIHGAYQTPPVIQTRGIDFTLISADYLHFLPLLVR